VSKNTRKKIIVLEKKLNSMRNIFFEYLKIHYNSQLKKNIIQQTNIQFFDSYSTIFSKLFVIWQINKKIKSKFTQINVFLGKK
jgi:hypothetical protein